MLLAVQLASSYPATAQTPSCSAGVTYANPLTLAGPYSDTILCQDLTEGLRLNLNGARFGESNDLIDPIVLDINAEGAGDKDVVVAGRTTIHSALHGMEVARDGTGVLRLDLKGEIVMSGESAATEGVGIRLVHKGKAGGTAEAPTRTKGIHLVSGADIDMSKLTIADKKGIIVHAGDFEATSPIHSVIPITIALTGGTIHADNGLSVEQFARGNIDVTIGPEAKLGTKEARIATLGLGVVLKDKSVGNITILHQGQIHAGAGIEARNLATSATEGDVTVTTAVGSVIVADGDTSPGIEAEVSETTSTGDIRVIHNGEIEAKYIGIFVVNSGKGDVTVETGMSSKIDTSDTNSEYASGINASVRDTSGEDVKGNVRVTHRGTISANAQGIYASNRKGATATGTIRVTTTERSTITAGNQGILIWHQGTGKSYVTIGGTVTGGTDHAGVHVQVKTTDTRTGGGSEIVIGPRAHVSSARSEDKVAIQVDARAGPTTITLDKDRNGVVGHVMGKILGTVTMQTRRGIAGTPETLEKDDTVLRRGMDMGVYDEVITARLTTITGGYKLEDVEGAQMQKAYKDQARLYEATAPVLQGLSTPLSYGTRMATPRLTGGGSVIVESTKGERVEAPQSRTGVWVRLATLEGDRRAQTSTTATGVGGQALSWDIEQTRVAIGLDVPTDDRLLLGVSTHWRQSKATVKDGGTMNVDGMGLGVSLTWTGDNGLYVDGQMSYTRFFDIEVNSNGTRITSTGSGSGVALGLEVGQPMSVGGLTVTPRGGLAWSSVKMDAFVEPTSLGGTGTVSPDRAESIMARVGVQAELGPSEGASRLYGSLDLEHEFRPEFEVMAGTTPLKGEVKPTWVRAGIGGAMPLGSDGRTMLAGDAFYATAGSDNADFGGGLSLTFRF